MEVLKKLRAPLRSSFTKVEEKLTELLSAEIKDLKAIEIQFAILKMNHKQIEKKNDEISGVLETTALEELDDESLAREMESVELYRNKFMELEIETTRALRQSVNVEPKGETNLEAMLQNLTKLLADRETMHSNGSSKRKYKLPDLELKKFDGNAREWLSFWSQFKKIDEDDDISREDKFQYLIQATAVGSRAREIVNSFPPTAEHYLEAIECLKSRFGRIDTLIDVYVRELLNIVLNRATNRERYSLVKLYDQLETQLRSLKVLGVTSEHCVAILYPMVESCLPVDLLKIWERKQVGRITLADPEGGGSDIRGNKLELLMDFLRIEVQSAEKVAVAVKGFGFHEPKNERNRPLPNKQKPMATGMELYSTQTATGEYNRENECFFCTDRSHASEQCREVTKLTLEEKRDLLKKAGACFKCLRRGKHNARFCEAKVNCPSCSRGHYEIMCPAKESGGTSLLDGSRNKHRKNSSDSNVLTTHLDLSLVMMQTLSVEIIHKARRIPCRALIDTGSSRSYIRSDLVRRLGIKARDRQEFVHSLFGGQLSPLKEHLKYEIKVSGLDAKRKCLMEFWDQDKICNDIPKIEQGKSWIQELEEKGIILSDTQLRSPLKDESIHLLIGADNASKIWTGRIHSSKSGPLAVHTKLGWTVMGKVPSCQQTTENVLHVSCLLNKDLNCLWDLEVMGIKDPLSSKSEKHVCEREMKEYFLKTLSREEDGRYSVALPWIRDKSVLPTNRDIAEKRLISAKKKLEPTGLMKEYSAVFADWESKKIIERVIDDNTKAGHYLPHRPVFKESSTTKIRPVFDASARKKEYFSLNDCLEKGPNLVALIPSILAGFRKNKFAVSSDIEKAFLNIGIQETDREYLKFLWCNEEGQTIVYRHRRVVFGISSSPYLLGATLSHHLTGAPDEFKDTAEKLKRTLYVDNCIASFESITDLEKFVIESRILLAAAQLNLRGWVANFPNKAMEESDEDDLTVLGLKWNIRTDTLSCNFKNRGRKEDEKITKRSVLSTVNKIFDPIGMTCPVTLIPKLVLQAAWSLKIGWDEELPKELNRRFKNWEERLKPIEEINIPRWLHFTKNDPTASSLHIFCDASKDAYAACIFLRSEIDDNVIIDLLLAKTRVAPLKEISIPRLELMACLIGARLAKTLISDLNLERVKKHYWTDANNALYWIKKIEVWATFVQNRVDEIRSLSCPDDWHHVPGYLNPADLPSRGCLADTLKESAWWEGPKWLKRPKEEWPKSEIFPDIEVTNSEKRKTVLVSVNVEKESFLSKFSSFPKLLRVTSFILRFLRNLKCGAENRRKGELDSEELRTAELTLMKIVQRDTFTYKDKRLKNLPIFEDSNNVIRLRTRITKRKDEENFLCPIVLPGEHFVVELLIRDTHRKYGHCGVQYLMSQLRENYWILKCRKTVSRIVKSCTICKRYESRPVEVPMAPLPSDRVRTTSVFEITGVDLAGPLNLKDGKKCWIVLFTCAVYRAIHLELSTSLSTESFLQSFRRFVARRGRPSIVYSDNGTNFTGASNLLKRINWEVVSRYSSVNKIQWKFIPPSAPWWGGWWERLVGIVKRMLRKILGRTSLNFEELNTVICECESIVNGRPLTYVSEDVEDLEPLTPAMFLQEVKEVGVSDLDLMDTKYFNRKYVYRQKLKDELRKRFRTEYLGQLQLKTQKLKRPKILKVGDVVLISSDNSRRLDWPLGRVIEIFRASDNQVRLVKLKTKNGEILRPTQRLYPLEVDGEEKDILKKSFL